MKSLKILLIAIILTSCTNNNQDCEAEKNKIINYYEEIFKKGDLTPSETSRLIKDRNEKLKKLDC